MREWVPCYPQTTEDRCAIAALQAVKSYWLRRNEEEELVALAGTVESGPIAGRGTTAIGIAKAAFAKGLQVTLACAVEAIPWLGDVEEINADLAAQAWLQQAVQFNDEVEAWQWLQNVVQDEKPVIISIVEESSLHSVVIVATTAETVTVIDPAHEPLRREFDPSQFLALWGAVLYIAILLTPLSG